MSQLPKNQQHNSLLTLTIGIMVAVGRAYLSDNNPDDLTTIMSIVNIVAFGFVITLMLNDIYNAVNIRISDSGKSTKSKQKLKFLLEVFFLCTFTLFSIIGINYIINHRNTTSKPRCTTSTHLRPLRRKQNAHTTNITPSIPSIPN